MFWQMLKGALIRQSRKMLMVALTIALGVSLTTAMLNVMLDVGDKVNKELKAYGANITVTPRAASILKDVYGIESKVGGKTEYLNENDLGKLKTIFWTNNIVAFAPYLETQVRINQTETAVPLVGTWFNYHLNLPTGEAVDTGIQELKSWWSVEGAWVQDSDMQMAMVGKSLAQKLGLKVGDRFVCTPTENGTGETLQVMGIFSAGAQEENQVVVPLALVQRMQKLEGKIDKIEVSAITTPENELARRAAHDPKDLSLKEWETWYCTAYVSSIAYQIEEAIQNSIAKPVRQVAESEGTILQKTELLMLLITALSLLSSALGISNLLSASIMERSREFGLLKALGATNRAVVLLTLTEIMITAFIGGFFGYFLGLGFARIIGESVFGSAVAINVMVIPWVAVLIILVTLIGSLPAIRMLLALRPAAVLHGR